MAQQTGWTIKRFAVAKRTLSTLMSNAKELNVRHMTIELAFKNGAIVQYVKVFEFDTVSGKTRGNGAVLIIDNKQQAHFAAEIGKAYALFVPVQGGPSAKVATVVYYPPLPDPANPTAPLPQKGNAATSWPAMGKPFFFVPVPQKGAIK